MSDTHELHPEWHVTIGGKGWLESATARSYYHFYRRTMLKFIEMVKTGQPPIPIEDTLEVMRVCLTAQLSIERGTKLSIDEAFPPSIKSS